jgi:cytochrome c5
MSNRGTNWLLVLLMLLLATFSCSKKEEGKTEEMKQAAPTDQKVTTTKPGQEPQGTGMSGAAEQGQMVYQKSCSSCHATGVDGAPKLGDQAAWESRLAKGKEQLLQSVLKGKGKMPPKGGALSLSEAEIRAAVDYMIDQAR